jgi:hypothetical protein
MAVKKMAVKKMAVKKARAVPVIPSAKELPGINVSATGCEKVWKGSVARLRIYDQPATTGKKVFAYLSPGNNSNYVGYSDDPNMIKALFLARDNGNEIQGYTNSKCRIELIDY